MEEKGLNDPDIESVKKAFERLEAIPHELENRVVEIIDKKGIVSRLYAEHEFMLIASEIFGSGEPDKIRKVIYDYFTNKYDEIKEMVHDKVMSDKNYLENLLTMLENPQLKDDEKLYTDTFGGHSKKISDRFGLENELDDYLTYVNPNAYEIVFERAKKWISGKYNGYVKSSGYRVIGDYISLYNKKLEDSERLRMINENEGIFIKGLKSKNHRVRRHCLRVLGGFIGVKMRTNPDLVIYKEIIKIANNSKDLLSKDARNILSIVS